MANMESKSRKVEMPEKLSVSLKDTQIGSHGGSTQWRVNLPTTILGMHVEEMPAGTTTTIHRHGEALIHILSGQGYSEIQGIKVEWKEGDFLMIPANAWHRHWNTGDKPVRFVAAYPSKLLRFIGVHYLEDQGYKTYKELEKEGLVGDIER